MKYRMCPDCNKSRVKCIRIDTFSEVYVDHMVECPKCGWYGVQSVDIEEAEPTQLKFLLEDNKEGAG